MPHHPVPIPGSARARLIEVGIAQFESLGYEAVGVVDLADSAGVTTGAIYHHFGSKLGLYRVIRDEMERRMTERMEGAIAAAGSGRHGANAALLVAFDAAVRFGVARILSEPAPDPGPDPIAAALAPAVADTPLAAACLAAVWRGALDAVARGAATVDARAGLEWVVAGGT